MPRGRKKVINKSFEDQLIEIEQQITECEETLKALKAKKKEIAAEKQNADLIVLSEAIKESGKSIQDAIKVIRGE